MVNLRRPVISVILCALLTVTIIKIDGYCDTVQPRAELLEFISAFVKMGNIIDEMERGNTLWIIFAQEDELYMIELLKHKNMMYRWVALHYMYRENKRSCIKHIIELSRVEQNPIIFQYAIFVLSRFDDEASQRRLAEIALDKKISNVFRYRALTRLDWRKGKLIQNTLKKCFDDKDYVMRWAACELVRRGSIEGFNRDVIKCLDDNSPILCAKAIEACGKINERGAIDKYVENKTQVRRIVKKAIDKTCGSEYCKRRNITSTDRILIFLSATRDVMKIERNWNPERYYEDSLIDPSYLFDVYVNYIHNQRYQLIGGSDFNIVLYNGRKIHSYSDTYVAPEGDNIDKAFSWVRDVRNEIKGKGGGAHPEIRSDAAIMTGGIIGSEGVIDIVNKDYPDRVVWGTGPWYPFWDINEDYEMYVLLYSHIPLALQVVISCGSIGQDTINNYEENRCVATAYYYSLYVTASEGIHVRITNDYIASYRTNRFETEEKDVLYHYLDEISEDRK